MFADTGIPALFQLAYSMGAIKKRLRVIAAGGAQVLESEAFQIGKQNQLAMKKIFWHAGVLLHHEEVGGNYSRTVRVEMQSGRVLMKTGCGAEAQLGSAFWSPGKEAIYGA
jgi:chemotaxis protein CheD